jgi:hypothetical protein
VGDGDFLDLALLVLGLSGMVEQEDREELLCFLGVGNIEEGIYLKRNNCYLVLTELLVGLDPLLFPPSIYCLEDDLK